MYQAKDTASQNSKLTYEALDSLNKAWFKNWEDAKKQLKDSSAIIKAQINDAYANSIGGYGYGLGVAQDGSKFVSSRAITWDFNRLNEIYRSQPLMAKICDTKSYEMFKAGIDLRSEVPPDRVSYVEKQLRIYDSCLSEAANWGFVYGLGASIIYLAGELNDKSLEKPLDMDLVTPNSFVGLKTVCRWQGIQPKGDDYVSPDNVKDGEARVEDLGEPLYYEVWFLNSNKKYRVHRSRLCIFTGNKLPGIENQIEMGCGVSEIERLWLPMLNYLSTINYVQNMLQISQQRVLFLAEGDRLGLLSEEGQAEFQRAMTQISHNASVNNMLVLDQNDEFEYKGANFANVDKIINAAQEDFAASACMPLNKLFGKSPTGLNNSSKENLTDFYDYILRLQNRILRPNYEKLIPIIYKSKYGEEMPEFSFDFKSLFMPDEQEKALIIDRKTRPLQKAWETNGITLLEYTQELREIGKVCDCFTNITDETVQNITKSGLENARFKDFENGYIVNSELVTDIGTLKRIYKDNIKKAKENKQKTGSNVDNEQEKPLNTKKGE